MNNFQRTIVPIIRPFLKITFYVGSRHDVRIYEPYNIETNAQATNIHQRLIWQEHRNMNFIATRRSFEFSLADHYQYLEAIA